VCVAGLDDARVTYCSSSCDPDGDPLTECEAPLSQCLDLEGTGDYRCYVGGPSPGAQGASCTSGDDCRSGACDGEFDICVEPCGDGQPACPDEYSCEQVSGVSVCTVPHGGGGCAVGGRGAAGGALLLVFGLGLALVRRRRG